MNGAASFPKRERIVSTRLIEKLFGNGSHSLAAYPLRAVIHSVAREETHTPVQLLISVPKKHFKHAVDRNRVKRQIREAFRHQKQPLCNAVAADQSLLVAFIWLSDRLVSSSVVNERIGKLLQRIIERVGESLDSGMELRIDESSDSEMRQ